ncbi:hypothetical protein FAD_0946 [Ferroplasma acidiphilum]|uniref:Uncharacterized protein n=1 Tax=Ferroplasma acidiphilum TaxID=74969 RepID=A0A1V0N3U9_9ARCH|nr:hypothetical protein [Ferroplasma acidiphilum]ARD84830.1 hypothetical protein FAD_0946 [Ferroplasma acidiphilum]
MQQDERISSLNREINLITFIGYREYLVLNFIRDNIKVNPSIIYIFSSKLPVLPSEQSNAQNEIILKKLKEYVKMNGKDVQIKENRTDNLWDIKYYYRTLKRLPAESNYIINISSGPGVYSAAAMLWALESDNQISYSVESWHNKTLQSAIFRNLNMQSFSFFNFKTDNMDRLIITALELGHNTTIDIKEYLSKQKGYKTTLRNIQVHIRELCNSGVLITDGNKPSTISFSNEFSKLGYSSSDFRK